MVGLGVGTLTWILQETPDISSFGRWHASETTRIYAANGELLSSIYEENRIFVPLNQVPDNLKNAVIAIEDTRFHRHFGIDLWAIGRALWRDIRGRAWLEGGSTITQQLAKNALLTHDQTLYRKIQDAYLAIQFERIYTKDEILEFYFNEIYLGHGSYGVQTAARNYFGKDVSQLSLAESAMLAGLIRAPYYYSPYIDREAAERRMNIVLNRMEDLEYITAREAHMARREEIELNSDDREQKQLAPYFRSHVQEELRKMFDDQQILRGGLQVYTTLDPEIQKKAEDTFSWALEQGVLPTVERNEGHTKEQPQVALVTLEPDTGAVKSLVGGRGDDHLNRAVQSKRQPGSAFKPFIYTAAVEEGYSPGSVIDDTPTDQFLDKEQVEEDLKFWPRNYDNSYGGPTTLREGLARSINVMAVKLMDEVGIEKTVDLIKRMGITTLVESGNKHDLVLPLALGGLTDGVTTMEMASSFGILANNGIYVEPYTIEKIVDNRGQVIYEHEPSREIVLEEEVAYLMTDMLKSVMDPSLVGTGRRANLDRPAAGKTGTTNEYTDAWFVGYTPDLVTSIWIGEDQPRPMRYSLDEGSWQLGSGTAVTIWGEYMQQVVSERPVTYFQKPENIVNLEIDPLTGLLPNEYTPKTIEEIFIAGTEPEEKTELHGPTVEVDVDTEHWSLATEYCPPENVETLTFQQETGYLLDERGWPVREKDPEIEVMPLKDDNGDYLYVSLPEEDCYVHKPPEAREEGEESIFDRIIDLFKIDDD